MAFSNLSKFGCDKSDLGRWASSNEAKSFVAEIESLKTKAFNGLLKDGTKNHDKHAECFKAYDSILKLFNEASEK